MTEEIKSREAKITKGQILRIQSILDKIDAPPAGKTEDGNFAVYDQLFDLYQIKIHSSYEDDNNVRLIGADEIVLTGVDLDRKLAEIQRNNHLPRAPKSDGFTSFTTIAKGPSNKIINQAISNKEDLIPKSQLIAIHSQALQEVNKALDEMNEVEFRIWIERCQAIADLGRSLANARGIKTYRDKVIDAEAGFTATKAKKSKSRWDKERERNAKLATKLEKIQEKGSLTPEMKELKKKMSAFGLDYNSPSDVIEYNNFLANLKKAK